MAYGFLRKVFEIFEAYRTPIDMITTSEVAVSLTIDNPQYLDQLTKDLRELGTVEVEENQSIICVVGDFRTDRTGSAPEIFEALDRIEPGVGGELQFTTQGAAAEDRGAAHHRVLVFGIQRGPQRAVLRLPVAALRFPRLARQRGEGLSHRAAHLGGAGRLQGRRALVFLALGLRLLRLSSRRRPAHTPRQSLASTWPARHSRKPCETI